MQILPLALTYGGVALIGAASWLGSVGRLDAAAAVVAIVVFAFAGRAWVAGVRPADVIAATPERRRVVAPALALLLVVGAIGAPLGPSSPVEPAAATHECSQTERIVTFSFGVGGYAGDKLLNDGKCTTSHRAEAVNSLKESDAQQEKIDIYNAALEQEAESETTTAIFENYLNDAESAAWMQAEMAVAEAYKNGSSQALAESKGRVAIGEYYAVKEVNLIEQWNGTVTAWRDMKDVAQSESGISKDYVTMAEYDGTTWYGGSDSHSVEIVTETVTLSNGSTHDVKAIDATVIFNGGYQTKFRISLVNGVSDSGDTWGGEPKQFRVTAPNDNYDNQLYVDFSAYSARYEKVGSQNDALQSEVEVFVNNTWDAYESGEIDASDVLSRNTQMFRYGNSALNGSNSTYDVTAALSSMGLASPELNGTGSMVVRYQDTEYNGLILARNAPSGGWEAGTTYASSNISGPVLLASTGGETIEVDGEFTVTSIRAEDGTEIQTVETQKTVYKTSNTTELLEKMERIEELRKEIESREPKAGGGGTDDGGDGLLNQLAAALGVSVGAAVVVVAGVGLVAVRVYSQ